MFRRADVWNRAAAALSRASIDAPGRDRMFGESRREELTMGPDADLLTISEAARRLRISTSLAYELVRQGRLPHLRLGRRVVVPARELDRWISERARLSVTQLRRQLWSIAG